MTPEMSESKGRSMMKKTSPSTGISDSVKVPHYLRASTGSCHDLCKHGDYRSRSTLSVDSTKTQRALRFRASSGSFHNNPCSDCGSNLTRSLQSDCKRGIKNVSEEGVRSDRRLPKPSPKETTETIVKREVVPLPLSSSLSSPMIAKPDKVKVKPLAALKGRNNSDVVATKTTTTTTATSSAVSSKTEVLKGRRDVTRVETGTSKSKMPEKIENAVETEASRHRVGNKPEKFVLEKTAAREVNVADIEIHNKKVVCRGKKSQELVSSKTGPVKSAKALPRPQPQLSSSSNPSKITTTRRATPSEDKPFPSMKLKFRRGTAPSPQPSEISDIPRRLKFRKPLHNINNTTSRTNVTSEEQPETPIKLPQNPTKALRTSTSNSSSKNAVENRGGVSSTRRSSFRKAGDNRSEISTRRLLMSYKSVGDNNGESSTKRFITPFKRSGSKGSASAASGGEFYSLKKRLKHQSAKKKFTRVLFNNVIEESASRLVESKKSKVKALVGAFETVIQELQPST